MKDKGQYTAIDKSQKIKLKNGKLNRKTNEPDNMQKNCKNTKLKHDFSLLSLFTRFVPRQDGIIVQC